MWWVYHAYLLTSTTSIAQLTKKWKRKSFPSLVLLDIFMRVNNWKMLALKVSYEFLVVIMVWKSDLFSILICSALSSLKVNAVHHWSHKALLESWGQNLCMDISYSYEGLKTLNFSSDAGLNWLYLLAREKKCTLFTGFFGDRPQTMQRAATYLDNSSSSFKYAYSQVLGAKSRGCPFSVLFLSPTLWTFMRKLVVWKHLEKIFVSTQPSCFMPFQY